ncbi:hypothetical protein HOLleu_35691 [Holothuria leucospilota]|uniref:G-protein coupled receptors family 1 profile domain-containing protein n=1 Tax=Holothuria leucospilota TaxID=206669 RepID=A0A9Q0YN93_HOLLE|nr:hypothetical protein HOLleu_35691 [Holothuria leucospilota]
MTDNQGICCFFANNNGTICSSPSSPFDACGSMFDSYVLRTALWLVSLASMVANLVVIVSRVKSKVPALRDMFSTEVNTNQNAFLLSLAIADFLMGVYLLCIGIADAIFGDSYFLSANGWRNGVWCKVIGFVAFVSNVASILSLTFVSIERFFSIVFPYARLRFGSRLTLWICVLIWIISGAMALTPIILSVFVQGVFGFSDVCLGLPFVTVPKITGNDVAFGFSDDGLSLAIVKGDSINLQWLYSQIVYIYFSSTCVLIITLCYVAMFISAIANKIRSGRHGNNKQEMRMAMKMSIIVGTDMICWLPVIVIGILSQAGLEISINMYAWIAVFVMPINSAFNPFIYTIPTIKKRKKNEPSFIPV